MKHLSRAARYGRFLALPINIRIGRKSLSGTGILALLGPFIICEENEVS